MRLENSMEVLKISWIKRKAIWKTRRRNLEEKKIITKNLNPKLELKKDN